MKNRRWLWLSVLIALSTALLFYACLESLDRRVEVPVASRPIDSHVRIDRSMIRKVRLAPDAVLAKALVREEDIIGAVTRQPLYPGEQFLSYKLVRDGPEGYLGAMSPASRALYLPLDTQVPHVLARGDLVDLILAFRDGAELLAQGVEVHEVVRDGRGGGETGLVLEVTQRQAERIAFGLENGRIYPVVVPYGGITGGSEVEWWP